MTKSPWVDYIGPTWEMVPGLSFYKTPVRTIGWECIAWIMEHCQADDKSGPFMFTPEQARFVLWFYEIDEAGDFTYDEAVLQRLKGWGKDPLVCLLSLFDALGDSRFKAFNEDSTIACKPVVNPLVVIAAVSQKQTDTTLRLYKVYLTAETIKKYRLEINTETVKSFGVVIIEALTSSPEGAEGKVTSLVIANETHHWHTRVGKEMWAVLVRNAIKVKNGTARVLSITNAYDPNLGSVAQKTRETYEAQVAKYGESKILYDSVEALPDAPIDTPEQIKEIVEAVRGNSDWAKIDRIVAEFFDTRNPPDLSRRFWFNTIVSSEDIWVDVRDFDITVRNTEKADIRVKPQEEIALFFDGSKSDDSTVLVGCRIKDGYCFKVAAWHKPRKGTGPAGTNWLVPRNDRDRARFDFDPALGFGNPYKGIETADEAVDRAFKTWKVVGFWADPSHAKDDIENKQYWSEAIEGWHIKYGKQLKIWAGNKSGSKADSITWDMVDRYKIEEFAEYAERVYELITRHEFLIENDPDFREHVKNARVYRTRDGNMSIWKGRKTSDKKIDLAVGMIGAFMVRSRYLKMTGATDVQRPYNPWARFAN
jgi:hypothetical protein